MANTDRLCMGCMQPLAEGKTVCPVCGFAADTPNPPLYLQTGTLLSDRYLVGRVLEAGGDAAVYMGYDQVLKAPITIREFLPTTLCEREPDGTLRVIAGCERPFAEYREIFRAHARAVARMRDLPASVPIYDIFSENETAYTVSEFCEGISLAERLHRVGGRMRWEEARPLFIPMMTSLIALHAAGIYHLGICPENLIVGADGKLRLCGFAIPQARTASSDLKPQYLSGYSAPEQYQLEQHVGEATDVYGLASTIFRTLVGNPPPDGAARSRDCRDLLVPAEAAKELPDHVAAALFNALQPDPEKRTATVAALRDQLSAAPAVTALLHDEQSAETAVSVPAAEPPEEDEKPEKDKKTGRRAGYAIAIVVGVLVVLVLIAGSILYMLFPDQMKEFFGGGSTPSSDITSGESSTAATIYRPDDDTSSEAELKYPVADVVGKNYYKVKDQSFGSRKLVLGGLRYSDTVPKGEILEQSPAAESEALITEAIEVIISAGPEKIQIPDVRGWKEEHARKYLEALGFEIEETVMLPVSSYERGCVDSISPAMGNRLSVGSKIILRVSNQAPTTTPTVPAPSSPQVPGIPGMAGQSPEGDE